MTKIQPPQTPPIAHTPAAPTHAASLKDAQHTPAVADTLAASHETHETSDTQPLQLHLPVPANLRPIRTHVLTHPAPPQPASPESEHTETPQGYQASAVAQGSIGLVALAERPAVPISGIWSSPMSHFSDLSSMSMGGQKTMALLASIDHHMGIWEAMLDTDQN